MTMVHPLFEAHHHSGERKGDILYRDNGEWKVLHIGSSAQVLTVASGLPSWASPAASAPTTADYLVGTANGSLSAEIVVGTSPGGELGGTWGSPTVDTTHSGSSHAGVVSTHEAASDPHTGYVLESRFTQKVKASDQTVSSDDTVNNDNEILQALGTSQRWAFHIYLDYLTGSTADIKFTFTVPTNATGSCHFQAIPDGTTSASNQEDGGGDLTSTYGVDLGATDAGLLIDGFVITDASNSGNIQLQWAQLSSVATDTTVKAGSYGIFTRLS